MTKPLHENYNRPGYIYFIGTDSYVKIGFARNPRNRLHELQCGNPEKLHLLNFFKATKDCEPIIQSHFANWQIRGEWFRWCEGLEELWDDVTDYIESPSDILEPRHVRFILNSLFNSWPKGTKFPNIPDREVKAA